jgi:hypothetical protein
VTGRHKRDTNGRRENIYRIPVIKIDTNHPVIVKPMKSRYLIQPRIKKDTPQKAYIIKNEEI